MTDPNRPLALPGRLRAASQAEAVRTAAWVIHDMCTSDDVPLDEALESIQHHCAEALAALFPPKPGALRGYDVDQQPVTEAPYDRSAVCRHCGRVIFTGPDRSWWADEAGFIRCMKVPIDEIGQTPSVPGHEPMPEGLAGAPTPVEGP